MPQLTIAQLTALNAQHWAAMKVKPNAFGIVDDVADRLIAARPRYEHVIDLITASGIATKMQWPFIAVVHEREMGQSWRGNLAQGDPYNAVSVHKPRGRGPFPSWEVAAVDALVVCEPKAALWQDWTIGGALACLEMYNGEGYELFHHMSSPYLWSMTDQYVKGKYVSDGHFDPDAIDHQMGCAALLARMKLKCPDINFAGM